MVRVTVFFLWEEGAMFDHEYYSGEHMDLMKELLLPYGLVRFESDQFLMAEGPRPGDVITASYAYFELQANAERGMRMIGQEMLNDVPNFTSLLPQMKMSMVTSHL